MPKQYQFTKYKNCFVLMQLHLMLKIFVCDAWIAFWIFLVDLSRRLKCIIVIKRCPSSVVETFPHFWLLLWNRWTEFNETWQEAWSQRPLPSFCFFGPNGKTRWPPWPLIGWDIFDFSSETAERSATKLDRKQDLNVLYQVCVFRAVRKNKMAALASDWLRHFRLLLQNR